MPIPRDNSAATENDYGVTEREIEVLSAVAGGLGNKDIAGRLSVAEETVKSHVKKVLRKLGATNRSHAVAIGFRSGLLQ